MSVVQRAWPHRQVEGGGACGDGGAWYEGRLGGSEGGGGGRGRGGRDVEGEYRRGSAHKRGRGCASVIGVQSTLHDGLLGAGGERRI